MSEGGSLSLDQGEGLVIAPNPSQQELQLMARLEELNRQLELDAKNMNSLASNHSRRSSDTSQISLTSINSTHSANGTTANLNGSADSATVVGTPTDEGPEDAWQTWGRLVSEWDTYVKKKPQYVKDLVRMGIPHHFRGLAWQLLSNAHSSPDRERYAEYMKSASPCEKVIRRDIARTYPDHELFKEKDGPGQEGLFNVMKAYSLHDREVGYCQGSAFIVGLLLMQMPEEEAFAVVVKIMQEYRMRELFKPSMAELGLCMYQLECLTQELLPDLHMHFQSQSFHTSIYASSWFLTLFSTTLPLQLAFRIMDVFISDGREMIFRIAIAILQLSKEELLSQDMEGMVKFLQKDMPAIYEADQDQLFNAAYQVKYNAKKMKKLEKEYTAKRTKEQEEMVEIRRLRTENRLLRQRIDYLEQESSALADRLIQGQVTRAQEAEETFGLKRELAAARQEKLNLMQSLEEATKHTQQWQEDFQREVKLQSADTCDLLEVLQKELVSIRLREAENCAVMRDLRAKLADYEETNKRLRETPPDSNTQQLQEELIAIKLREAETTLAMKELSKRIDEMNEMWEAQLKESHSPVNGVRKDKSVMGQLNEDLLSAKMREAAAIAQLKEQNHKIMELESQVQVHLNKLKRQEVEVKDFQDKVEQLASKEKDMIHFQKDEARKFSDLESKINKIRTAKIRQTKEELMMSRIREMERSQTIAELEQRLSSMECKHQELLTSKQLHNENENEEVCRLQDRVSDLQADVIRLESLNRKLTSALNIQQTTPEKIPINHRNGTTY